MTFFVVGNFLQCLQVFFLQFLPSLKIWTIKRDTGQNLQFYDVQQPPRCLNIALINNFVMLDLFFLNLKENWKNTTQTSHFGQVVDTALE